jgi:hypothetical protein
VIRDMAASRRERRELDAIKSAVVAVMESVSTAGSATLPHEQSVATRAVDDASAAYPDRYATGPLAAETEIAAKAGRAAHEVDRVVTGGHAQLDRWSLHVTAAEAPLVIAHDRAQRAEVAAGLALERLRRMPEALGRARAALAPWLVVVAALLPAPVDAFLMYPIFLRYAPIADAVYGTRDTTVAWVGTATWVLLQFAAGVVAGTLLLGRRAGARALGVALVVVLLLASAGAIVVRSRTFDAQSAPVDAAASITGDTVADLGGWPTLALFAGMQLALVALALAAGFLHAESVVPGARDENRAQRRARAARMRSADRLGRVRGVGALVERTQADLDVTGTQRQEEIRAVGLHLLAVYRAQLVRHSTNADDAQAIQQLAPVDLNQYMPAERLSVLGLGTSAPASPTLSVGSVLNLGSVTP